MEAHPNFEKCHDDLAMSLMDTGVSVPRPWNALPNIYAALGAIFTLSNVPFFWLPDILYWGSVRRLSPNAPKQPLYAVNSLHPYASRWQQLHEFLKELKKVVTKITVLWFNEEPHLRKWTIPNSLFARHFQNLYSLLSQSSGLLNLGCRLELSEKA